MISIIIPVYKAERYLTKCVDSILAQTYADWELLLVDDGSPDNSGELCDEYAAKDKRIKVFHKENGGVSSARNLGLEMMAGEWITFVDADDWIAPDTLERCSTYFNEYEIVRFSMKMVYDEQDDSKNRNYIIQSSNNKEEIFSRTLARNSLMCVWGGVYRTDLFRQNNIRFSTSLVMAEDWLVIMLLLLKAHRVIDLPEIYYFYNQLNESSCSNNPTVKKVENCLQALEEINKILGASKINYRNSINKCEAILWKAMIHALVSKSKSKFIREMRLMKRRYHFPSLIIFLKSDFTLISKVACVIGSIV